MMAITKKMSASTNRQRADEVEVGPGLFVARRSMLTGLGGLMLAALPGRGFAGALQDDLADPRTFDEFIAAANPLASRLVGDTSRAGQDRYLRSIANLTTNLAGVPVPQRWNFSDQGTRADAYAIGFNPGGDPFRVLHWRLEPGASCRAHAHTYGNVVTLGLAGAARVHNYEVVGEPDFTFTGTFQVRQTLDQVLRPGSVNLVSLQRNYIHELIAGPDGARGLDITTPLRERPAFGTPYLDIAEKPVDEFERIYEAAWALVN
jgi:quercetin dioxygenase-like cupin family protein